MPYTGPEHTGMRIAKHRKLRRLTQQALAERAGISASLLTKIERGERPATPAVLGAISRALHVPVADLLGQPYLTELQADQLDALIDPIRTSLELYDLGADPMLAPRPLEQLTAKADELCAAMRRASVKAVAAELPTALAEATAAAQATPSTEAWMVLASLYRTAFDTADKLGFIDLSQVALDRMAWAAGRASDPTVEAVRQYLRSLSCLRSGRLAVGGRILAAGLDLLEQAEPGRVRDVVTGQLHLGAAMVAARSEDEDGTAYHLAVSERIAAATGPAEKVHWLSYGPANVAVHQVAALAELRKYDEAVDAARHVAIPDNWPATRRAHHLAEVARAQLWLDRPDAALRNLQQARAAAPQMMRYHPMMRETVSGLVAARRATTNSLANLATWAGI